VVSLVPETDARDRPVGELMKELSAQTSTLVRKELELARAELTEKGKQAGVGAGMFGGAGVFAVLTLGLLAATVIAALDTAMPLWLAALIVTVVCGAVAGVLALVGKKKTQEAVPPVPEQAIESTKEDVQWAKNQTRSAAR
jgi:uncharacterized membrane protein YqjE